jgi:hypothetical protein
MEDRTLRGAVSVILSVIFEGYGMRELFVAYRTGNRTAWTEKAV